VERTATTHEEAGETTEQEESPAEGVINGPVRALKRAYALIA
jgi:hypothetical protein